jgi:chromosome partitioning protein
MIVVIGGIKGGSGKTTLATNLTVLRSSAGKRVLFVDADEQRSAVDWVEHREGLGIATPWTTVQLAGSSVRSQIQKMAPDYDDIIVDTGGRDTTSQRAAMTLADVFLSPFQPRSLDVWTLGRVVDLIDDIRSVNDKLQAFAVINRADPQGSDNSEAAEIIARATGIHYLDTPIGQRKAFSNAAADGLSVNELKGADQKAKSEIKALYTAIFDGILPSKQLQTEVERASK